MLQYEPMHRGRSVLRWTVVLIRRLLHAHRRGLLHAALLRGGDV